MRQVHIFENRPPMHEAVGPIKIRIVDGQAEEEADRQIVQGVLAKTPVNARASSLVKLKQRGRHDGEDRNSQERKADLSPNLLAGRPPLLDALLLFQWVATHVINEVKVARRQQITEEQDK